MIVVQSKHCFILTLFYIDVFFYKVYVSIYPTNGMKIIYRRFRYEWMKLRRLWDFFFFNFACRNHLSKSTICLVLCTNLVTINYEKLEKKNCLKLYILLESCKTVEVVKPFQILLGNFLGFFRILSNFFCQRATFRNFSENYHFFGNFWAILNQNAE